MKKIRIRLVMLSSLAFFSLISLLRLSFHFPNIDSPERHHTEFDRLLGRLQDARRVPPAAPLLKGSSHVSLSTGVQRTTERHRNILAVYQGVDLQSAEPAEQPQPGGTEEEALVHRREVSSANWPLNLSNVRWRVGPRPTMSADILSAQVRQPSRREEAWKSCKSFDCVWNEYNKEEKISSDQQRKCDETYGYSLLLRFRAAEHLLCGGGISNLRCKQVLVHETHTVQTSICSGENIMVDFGRIDNGEYPWLHYQAGALSVHCKKMLEVEWAFIHCLADWMDLGFHSLPNPQECDHTIETPTVFVTRSGDYSPFAATHDALNMVLLYAVEGVDLSNVQVVIMDRMAVGFYSPLWQVLFSPTAPVVWYTDLREEYRGKKVCYTKAYFNIPARLSPIYNQDTCGGSTLYRLYVDALMHSIGEMNLSSIPSRVIVTVISRRNYNTGHPIGRRFLNAKELIVTLRSVHPLLIVNEVDYADFDFDQQISISRATDLLVAMHGAGLAHMMFMQPEYGGVFEFFCPEKPSSNYRYQQLALKMGLVYDSFSINNDANKVELPQVLPQLKTIVRIVTEKKRIFLAKSLE